MARDAGIPPGVELVLEAGQSRRLQIGPFEAADHVRENVEVPCRPFGRMCSACCRRTRAAESKTHFSCHDGEEGSEVARHERIHGGRDGHRRERSQRRAAIDVSGRRRLPPTG